MKAAESRPSKIAYISKRLSIQKKIRLPCLFAHADKILHKKEIVWPFRFFEQAHSGLCRRSVSLFVVAFHAGADKVFPCIAAAPRFRNDVINGQRTFACPAVLTPVGIAAKHICPVQFNSLSRHIDIACQPDHARHR